VVLHDTPQSSPTRAAIHNNPSAECPDDLCTPSSSPSNKEAVAKSNSSASEYDCNNNTNNIQAETSDLHRESALVPSPLQRRVTNKPRDSLLCFKSTSADGDMRLHHRSTGTYEVDLNISDFYEIIDVISVGGHIESLQWRNYKGKEDLPSIITKHLGKIPVFFQHLVPRYYATTVVARYKRKPNDAINKTSSLKRRIKKAKAGLVIYKYGKYAHAKEYECKTTFCVGFDEDGIVQLVSGKSPTVKLYAIVAGNKDGNCVHKDGVDLHRCHGVF
jgi:hypothetical protein